jgi:hypothetical protein
LFSIIEGRIKVHGGGFGINAGNSTGSGASELSGTGGGSQVKLMQGVEQRKKYATVKGL